MNRVPRTDAALLSERHANAEVCLDRDSGRDTRSFVVISMAPPLLKS